MLTLKQKRQVSKYLTANRDGKCGRFFMGWSNQLLSESAERKGAY